MVYEVYTAGYDEGKGEGVKTVRQAIHYVVLERVGFSSLFGLPTAYRFQS